MLANVSALVVPGDFHNGTEMTSLDNVALTVPEPSTWAAVLADTGFFAFVLQRRTRRGSDKLRSASN